MPKGGALLAGCVLAVCLVPKPSSARNFGVPTNGTPLHELARDQWTVADGLGSNTLRSILRSRDGYLWLGTHGGLARFDGLRLRVFDTINTAVLASNQVLALVEATDGSIWVDGAGQLLIGGNGGLSALRGDEIRSLSLGQQVRAIASSRENGWWLATNAEVVRLTREGAAETFGAADCLGDRRARAVIEDRDGHVWVGTYSAGLHQFRPPLVRSITAKEGLSAGTPWVVRESASGDFWIGTTKGLDRLLDGKIVAHYTRANGLPSDSILGLWSDEDGTFWVGATRGLARSQAVGGAVVAFEPVPLGEEIGGMARSGQGILRDRAGTMWLTLRNNGGVLPQEGDGFRPVPLLVGASSEWIHEDRTGTLWVGTQRHGLYALRGGQWRRYSAVDGVPSSSMESVHEDRKGAPAGWKSRVGLLYFACTGGVVIIDPDEIRSPPPPPVAIDTVIEDGEAVEPHATHTLTTGRHRLEIRFHALSFVDQERIDFEHRLSGFDEEWLPAVNQGAAQYTNLQPGTYRFEVRARFAGGPWSRRPPASSSFRIRPSWWQTVWFRTVLMLVLAGIMLAFERTHVRHLARKAQHLEEENAARRRTTQVLRESEDLITSTLNSMPAHIAVLDAEGIIIRVNASWKRFATDNNARFDGLGSNYLDVCRKSADHDDLARQALVGLEALLDGRATSFELEYRCLGPKKDQWFLMQAVPMQFSRGGAVVSHLDISDTVRNQNLLQRSRDEVAHLSRVSAMGELTGVLAHELSQPLTAIHTNAQVARRLLSRDHLEIDELREICQDIIDDEVRAANVIRQVRDLMKNRESELLIIDFNMLILDTVDLLHSDAILRSATIDLDLARELPSIQADRNQLQQVLINLITNGLDAMDGTPAKDKVLTVGSRYHQSHVRGYVRDCGSGFATDDPGRLFEPFFSTKTEGMGLGLAICRSVMEKHGGSIEARNNRDRGATFEITLRQAEAE